MNRLTEKNKFDTHYGISISKNLLQSAYDKLGQLEDLEEEIGCEIEVILKYLKNGYTDKNGVFHKQTYLAFVDDEWCICDLQTDEWFLLKNKGE